MNHPFATAHDTVNAARAPEEALVRFGNLGKRFASQQRQVDVLSGFNLSITRGEFVALVGPSGCGKSTLLRIVAGLDRDFEGDVRIHGDAPVLPSRRTGIVFQDSRLFPWLSVRENVALGLAREKLDGATRAARIDAQIEAVGLAGFADSLPHQLSGGMAQRVSLARTLVAEPEVLLLDEPFSALDALTKAQMHELLLSLHARRPFTALMVTHDVEEAIWLADRVVVLAARPGRIRHIERVELSRPRPRSGAPFQQIRERLIHHLGLPEALPV